MLYDFHTHTFQSDGALSPIELINRAVVKGYNLVAITDHVGQGSLERVLKEVREDCLLAQKHWHIRALWGVELTHLPPKAIDEVAKKARDLGALVVIVHGETTAEPVPRGTNLAALSSKYVDILGHPGLITEQEAELAAKSGIFLELSARRGHRNTNAHVAQAAQKAGAKLLVDSDAHDEDDLLTEETVKDILIQADVYWQHEKILKENPQLLVKKIDNREPPSVDDNLPSPVGG